MNKTALKKFAIEARNDLRGKVKTKAFQYGIQTSLLKVLRNECKLDGVDELLEFLE